ncbi:hypothetical protein RND71_017368 [Anisodus tanguticus]|uniref:RING-type domain-containing protein n=1 Tax=Anisodus tanguticus TaxID=243964 RepID=A0AAE1S2L9_9SOLA|nr:hypothetical protein RND71_017368 [Anisodus tanguticus]
MEMSRPTISQVLSFHSSYSMGCDKTDNLPDPNSFHAFDDLALSIRQSGNVDYNGVIQGGFSSGANVASFPFVSLPAVRPLPGNVNEMNFEMVNLKNLNTFHHHHLEPNLMNVRNIAPSFSTPSEMPHCMENCAEINHLNMNNNMLALDSLMNEGVLSKGIQNPGANMNFMPMQSRGAECLEKAGKTTGISQNSLQASGSPFDIGYNMQNTKSIGGIGIHNDAKVNPVPFSLPENIDGSFLTLGIGSNIEDRSNIRFNGKEVSSRLEEAVLPQSNNANVQQMRRNFPSLIHGVAGGITNFRRGTGGLPNSARNSGVSTCPSNNESVLAPGSRISAPPFMYITPDAQLNSSSTRNLGAVGKADLRFSGPDPLKHAQGGLPPPLPFSSNSTLPPHLQFGRMAAIQSAQPVRVAAQPTIKQQSNPYTNISRNQSFTGSPILSHGSSRVRQDHLGQQSFVNVPHPLGNNVFPPHHWGNNVFPEGMGAQIAGRGGIQPAPGNQFPKRLGVHLNDGAISQATREGVIPGTGGIQQIRHGRPQGGSPANYNVSGLPYHAGQGVPISKVDLAPQASYIHGQTSRKRRAAGAPPTAPTCQRRRTLTQHNQQLIAHLKQNTNAPVPASSPSLPSPRVKWQGLEESPQPIGEKCLLCKRDMAFNPEGPISRPAIPPPVAVLPCGHVFHDHCLQLITPKDQSKNPPCIPCALGET